MKDTLIDMSPLTPRQVTACSSAGQLNARIMRPARLRDAPPLLVLHGISRNAGMLARLFAPEAERTGRTLLVPHFPAETWPDFQRPSKTARPDLALLALLDLVATEYPDIAGPVDIFGNSGGAQLAHRLAMLYPHRVAAIHLAAAGWYCLPDESMSYPYGLAPGKDAFSAKLIRRNTAALRDFLHIPACVYVGTEDVTRDDALRKTCALDARQGPHRHARARTYVTALNAAAEAAGIPPQARLIEMTDCDHDVVRAITQNQLAARVLDARAASSDPS